MEQDLEMLEGQRCPYCLKDTLTLMERVLDIPEYGVLHVFGMKCENDECGYEMSDLEAEDDKPAYKETIEVDEDKLNWYVVKSASATISIPRMLTMEPGADSDGFITTIEGVLNRFKAVLEELRQDDDKSVSKKAKNKIKKIQKVLMGQDTLKLTLDDPSGTSKFIKKSLDLD